MSPLSQSDALASYGALAGVAAITTAILAVVALQPLSQADDVTRRMRASTQGQPPYTDAHNDAGTYFRAAVLLVAGGLVVNGAVLGSWGFVALEVVKSPPAYLLIPFAAVAAAYVYLGIAAVVGIKRLHDAGG